MDRPQALEIIEQAVERSDKQAGADANTINALRFLLRSSSEPAFRDTLVWFKESLDSPNYIGRFQNANASRNRMRFLLGLPAK